MGAKELAMGNRTSNRDVVHGITISGLLDFVVFSMVFFLVWIRWKTVRILCVWWVVTPSH